VAFGDADDLVFDWAGIGVHVNFSHAKHQPPG